MPAAPPADFVAALSGYQPLLRRVVRLYCQDVDDRQDLFQEMVLQLWRAWPRYVPQPGARLSTWLCRIALAVAQVPEPGFDADDQAALYLATR